jgi:DNA-binding NarL/FixJ family response regulator
MARENGKRSVLIVDDDAAVRSLIAALIARAGFAWREAASGEEALEAVHEDCPDVVLLDVELPGLSGYEVCRELREEFGYGISIAFISGERLEPLDRVAGLLIGADDYLVKPFLPDELIARVRALSRRRAPPDAESPYGLTQRELGILGLLAEGLRQDEIASRLVVSQKTVANHIQHILVKLGVHSRAEAVAKAYREGLERAAGGIHRNQAL